MPDLNSLAERLDTAARTASATTQLTAAHPDLSLDDAYAKIRAGANLVQLYSALIFKGPALIPEIIEGLPKKLKADGFSSLAQAVGSGLLK